MVTCVCVKRQYESPNNKQSPQEKSPNNKQSPQETKPLYEEKALYEEVCLSSHNVNKDDLELQPNPAYGTSHNVVMDTNPAYESCK